MKEELYHIGKSFEGAGIQCTVTGSDDLGTKAAYELTGLVNARFLAEVRPTLNPFRASKIIVTYPDASRKTFGFGDPSIGCGDPMLGFADKHRDMGEYGRKVASSVVKRFVEKQFRM